MSLMGWSSADMAKRYQHVTDSVRADVATQVGNLIWEARSEIPGGETVTLRRSTLATILPLLEEALAATTESVDLTELRTAFVDLHKAMSEPTTSSSEIRNETKTETTGP